MKQVIFGCGDIGRRISKQLIDSGVSTDEILAYVKQSTEQAKRLDIKVFSVDLDSEPVKLNGCQAAQVYYTIAPQKEGTEDLRSRNLIQSLQQQAIRFQRLVLISTTGVYGDCEGEWVNEESNTEPQTERGQRRLDSERQWLTWGVSQNMDVVILRVPGIYAHSRLPRARIEKKIPVVRAQECGFTNRIHADDLADACIQAMKYGRAGHIYNITDGTPGKISEYLQTAAQVLGLPPLPEITMQQAQGILSSAMLSYLGESRKISNAKMLADLKVNLRYPDFREGVKHG